ncbi:sulfotransferase domain-containing protein [Nocardioides sp. LMS-CY]|uniref:sulfotransferase domain-containing protein n=1 Tax=Nocardioides sp. (strain LMS-CY) TaxID=2840457 RepID=UPI001C0088D9|nr:sulfotransferase domain-containing protein [Nocardioides sp. LMS-CY]QWF23727.1 sulfotransferase domain-containing protein [Nocardioides sp. LMS-CY]
MSDPSRVFLHIGLPKTGTTYLQEALWLNRDRLAERGLYLPGARRQHLLASLELREDPGLANRPRHVEHPWTHLTDLVRTRLRKKGGDALISHEFFASATPAQVERAREAFPDAELHVVLTARPTVDLFTSRWQEWVKNGNHLPIDSYPPEPKGVSAWGWASFDLGDVLERWGSVLDHERIHVVPLTKGAGPRALWDTFLDVCGQGSDGLESQEQPANTSLGLVEVEVLRRTNAELRGFTSPTDRGRWIRGHLGERTLVHEGAERYRPSAEKLAELRRREERTLGLLAGGGFDLRGDLDLLRSADISARRHPSDATDAELLSVAVGAVAALLTDLRAAAERAGDVPVLDAKPSRWRRRRE